MTLLHRRSISKIIIPLQVAILVCSLFANFSAFGAPSAWLSKRANWAKDAMDRSRGPLFVEQIMGMLDETDGASYARGFLADSPAARNFLKTSVDATIAGFKDPDEAVGLGKTIGRLMAAGCISDSDSVDLRGKLEQRVALTAENGTVAFTLVHAKGDLIVLTRASTFPSVLRNSLSVLRDPSGVNKLAIVNAVSETLVGQGKTGPAYDLVKESLPRLVLRKEELKVLEDLFPEIVGAQLNSGSLKVAMTVKGIDRIAKSELEGAIKAKVPNIEFVPIGLGPQIVIEIERIRHEENKEPARQQTITIPRYNVDTASALFLMPQESTYSYDVVTEIKEIEYGYILDFTPSGEPKIETVIKGRVGGQYSRCINQRIQTAFGGVISANFVANAAMRSQCASGTEIGLDKLRGDVTEKLVEAIVLLPKISAAYALSK